MTECVCFCRVAGTLLRVVLKGVRSGASPAHPDADTSSPSYLSKGTGCEPHGAGTVGRCFFCFASRTRSNEYLENVCLVANRFSFFAFPPMLKERRRFQLE